MGEQEIIDLLCKKEEAGMEAFLCQYGPLIRYVVAPILPDERDREDCFSEISIKVWEKIARFDRKRGSFSAWLTTIARNAALNIRRKHLRQSPDNEFLENEAASRDPTPEELMLQKERAEALELALRRLSQRERALFYRKYYYLQPTAQIAAELGMTERAVEGRLYRMKRKLRKLLGGEDDA